MSVVNPLPVVLGVDTEDVTIIDISKIGDISGEQVTYSSLFLMM